MVCSPNSEDVKDNVAIRPVAHTAATGTPRLFNLANILGALPLVAMDWSILEPVYRPELPQDRTEVRMTAFSTEAAAAKPALLKITTMGEAATFSTLPPRISGLVNGINVPAIKIEPM